MPLSFINGAERAGADPGEQTHLAGLDLPVIAGISLLSGTLETPAESSEAHTAHVMLCYSETVLI